MKATEIKPGRTFELAGTLYAVALVNHEGPDPNVIALFMYADHAKRWGDDNYTGRFEVVEVRL